MEQTIDNPPQITTDRRIRQNLSLLGLVLVFGLGVVFLLRQQWAKDQWWPWLLLLAVMFVGASALRKLELWLPGDPILPKLAKYVERRDQLIGLACILISIGLAGYLVWRL